MMKILDALKGIASGNYFADDKNKQPSPQSAGKVKHLTDTENAKLYELDVKSLVLKFMIDVSLMKKCLADPTITEKLLATHESRDQLLTLALTSEEHRNALVVSNIFSQHHDEQTQLHTIVESYIHQPEKRN